MTSSLLDVLFGRLHSIRFPVLWHRDCSAFQGEFEELVAIGVLTRASDADTLPAERKPDIGVELEVKTLDDGRIVGFAKDEDGPVEVPLTETEIRRYKINMEALLRELRAASGLQGIAQKFDDDLLKLGLRTESEGPTHVYLAAPVATGVDLVARCRRLHHLYPNRRVTVITFRPVPLDLSIEEEFEHNLRFTLLSLRGPDGRSSWCPQWPGDQTAPPPSGTDDYIFRPTANGWEIVFAGRPVSVDPKLKGLRYIHHLMTHSGEPISVEELLAETEPHPDQINEEGKVTVLPSAGDEARPPVANLRRLERKLGEMTKQLTTASVEQQPELIEKMAKLRKYLTEEKRAGRTSGKAGDCKRVGVTNAINRAVAKFPAPMRRYFKAPNLFLGFKPMHSPSREITWVTK